MFTHRTVLHRAIIGLALLSLIAARASAQGAWIVNPANGHEYRLTNGFYWGASDTSAPTLPDWWNAEAEATTSGGHLVTINDAAENSWLVATFGSTFYWIGLTDWGSEGSFHWISGEPVTYLNWDTGQPDNAHAGGEDTVHINHWGTAGVWNDLGAKGNSPTHPNPYRGIIERPAPAVVYCTAKMTSSGCVPAIGFNGAPSASAGSGFLITAVQVEPNKFGLFFYSKAGQQAVPFQGGILCVKPPLVRTPLQNSGGAAACSGTYSVDFNAYVASGKDPGLAAGAAVDGQYWFRDPGFAPPNNAGLTDAIDFTLAP